MNGFFFTQIAKFGLARLGEPGWRETLRAAGTPPRTYYLVADYPDKEAVAQLAEISRVTGDSYAEVLQGFGEFMVPDLLKKAKFWIRQEWKTLDLIANTEQTIHEVLRSDSSRSDPPRLQCRRTGADEVIVTYTSVRRMCSVAKGIVAGVARHYGEAVSLSEPVCMLAGADRCELVVRVNR